MDRHLPVGPVFFKSRYINKTQKEEDMRKFKSIPIVLLLFILIAGICSADEGEWDSATKLSMRWSQWVAKRFVLKSPTFVFDGLRNSLELTQTTRLRCPDCWEMTYEFDCSNAGYGDRSEEKVMPAVTHHVARITTESFKVTRAVMDDRWDMLNQEMLGEETSQPITQEEIDAQVQGNNAFAFDLYQKLSVEDGNLFYSPYSISLALAMAFAGAGGETESQMAQTLHYDFGQEKLHPVFKALSDELAGRSYEDATPEEGRGLKLNVANAAWGQEGYAFLDSYLGVLSENYDGGLKTVDFINATEEARLTINDWVADQTEDRITDLIAPGVLSDMTRLVLTNAVYFNAAWEYPFSEEVTSPDQFFPENADPVEVDMMHQSEDFLYGEGQGYQAIALPYERKELSMLILLPDKDQFAAFESELTSGKVESILEEMARQEVILSMPKFTFKSDFSLGSTLAAMGMPNAFSEAADFSGITGDRDLFISNVIHKSFVAVDEEGTEAAAATAVVFDTTASPLEPAVMTIDRPFIFMIRDHQTNSILFVGRVLDPTQ